MSWGGAFDFLFCTGQRVLVYNYCHWGEEFFTLQVVSWEGFDQIDSHIRSRWERPARAEMRVAKVHSPDSNSRVFYSH